MSAIMNTNVMTNVMTPKIALRDTVGAGAACFVTNIDSNMCMITIRKCRRCSSEDSSTFVLCDGGTTGHVCVGPSTSSGMAYLKIDNAGNNSIPKADMTTIVPSTVILIKSRECSVCSDPV